MKRIRGLGVVLAIGIATSCSSDTGSTISAPSTTTTVSAEPTPTTTSPPEPAPSSTVESSDPETIALRTGAEVAAGNDFVDWHGLRVGLIAHTNSRVGDKHLADLLHAHPEVELAALFAPEHGIRGRIDAGAAVADDIDETGVTIHSLYGDTRAPTAETLADVDVLVYDLQDVGVRWFTYISTMGLAMQAAAEHGVPFVVLDRPNPLGRSTPPGAVRGPEVDSFIAAHPIADAYGLTAGELARAIREEAWLPGLDELHLSVVPMEHWNPDSRWHDLDRPWIPPSPSLTTADAALLYPATVWFEATGLSIGRGTDAPFTVIGGPDLDAESIVTELASRRLGGVSFTTDRVTPTTEPHAETPIEVVRLTVDDHTLVDPLTIGVHLLDAVIRIEGPEVLERPEFLDLLAGGPQLRERLLAGDDPADVARDRHAEGRRFADHVEIHHLYG